jgi:hypothetical protein
MVTGKVAARAPGATAKDVPFAQGPAYRRQVRAGRPPARWRKEWEKQPRDTPAQITLKSHTGWPLGTTTGKGQAEKLDAVSPHPIDSRSARCPTPDGAPSTPMCQTGALAKRRDPEDRPSRLPASPDVRLATVNQCNYFCNWYLKRETRSACSRMTRALSLAAVPVDSPRYMIRGFDQYGMRGQPPHPSW